MSGFFGILRHDGRAVEERFLQAMADRMAFRGPDGGNLWKNNNIGSCFALMLTGPGKQAQQQPVMWRDRYLLWGDVRLDAREDLQRQLEAADLDKHTPVTHEELFLRAWEKWGAVALDRILGDFSLALWDAAEEVLWCARDFVGARPFYYGQSPELFCFSNTLQILPAVPGLSRELDQVFLGDFLVEGWSIDQARTIYRDMKRLPAGHLLRVSKGNLEEVRFRKLPIEEPVHLKTPEEYLTAYRELLNVAVNDRLPDAPTACYLSGGLDSTSVCAVASQIADARDQKQRLKAFTLSFRPFFDDPEPALAKVAARHLGISHEILEEPELRTFEGADTEHGKTPEPNEEFYFAREHRNVARISQYSRVVLSGDGGDDVLTGQSWPYFRYLAGRGKWTQIVRDFGGYVWDHKRLPPLRGGFRAKFQQFVGAGEPDDDYPEWLNQDFAKIIGLQQRWHDFRNSPEDAQHPTHPLAYKSLHSGLWASILETEDAGWNRVPLETRAPLLDLRILTFLLRLPQVPWCMDKYLCRQAMKNLLPTAITERPKTPARMDLVGLSGNDSSWIERLPKSRAGRIESFVNWDKWCETLYQSKGSLSRSSLRPAALFFWLKAVESQFGFQ